MKKSLSFLCIVCLSALMACTRQDVPTDNAPRLYEEVRSANKMVFAKMAITKTAKTERKDWYKVGKRIAVYAYDSYLRAYIDLSELAPSDLQVDEENHTVHLTLPPVKTEVTGRDMQMRRVYENVGILRSDIDAKERAEIKEKTNASFKREIAENPEFKRQLTESAQRKARAYFETLFSNEGYTAYIDFKPSN